MNPDSPVSSNSSTLTRTLLQQEGVIATLSLIGPGDTLRENEDRPVQDHLLFVVDGSANLQLDELNFLLKKDQALYVAKEKSEALRNQSDGWVKLLRVDLPAPQTSPAQIFTVSDGSVFESEMSGH